MVIVVEAIRNIFFNFLISTLTTQHLPPQLPNSLGTTGVDEFCEEQAPVAVEVAKVKLEGGRSMEH